MATHKRLNIVVDGTTAMGAYWRTLVLSYLENIVRCFFGQSAGKDVAEATVELGLTVYGARKNFYPVHVTNWTTNLELFLEALSTLTFNGGASEEPAIAEGLAGALLMFSKPDNGRPSKEYHACERHCILVAATGPIPLPSPLFVPRIHEGRVCSDQAEWRMVDAMGVAHMFPEYAVSLSVVSPHLLPLLREIFIQGNYITEGSNAGVSKIRNGGQFLLLLSDKLLEACNAVKHVQASESAQGAEENLLFQQGCLKDHDKFSGSSSGKKRVEPNHAASSQWSVPNSDYASSSNTPCNPNDMSIYSDIIAELDAGLVVLSPSTPVTRGNLFDEMTTLGAELSFTGVIGRQQTEAMSRIPCSEMSMQQRTKNMDPKSIARSRRHALQKNKRLAKQASVPVTHRAAKSEKRTARLRRVKKFRSLSMIAPVYDTTQRPLHTMAPRVVMNASAPGDSSMVLSQCASLSRSLGTQQCASYASSSSAMDSRAESRRMGSKRTKTNASGELSIQMNANTDIPMVDIPQEPDVEMVPLPDEMPERNHEGHVLAWGGPISAIYKGQVIFICTAKAYRSITSRETLTDGWPESIEVKKIRRQNDIKNKIIANHWRAHYLILDVTTSHKVIHEKLISRGLCAKVMLANDQVMYIVPTKGIQHFIGILYDQNI